MSFFKVKIQSNYRNMKIRYMYSACKSFYLRVYILAATTKEYTCGMGLDFFGPFLSYM